MISDYRVTIRHATPQHIPSMLRLERASGTAAHWSDAEYGRLFQEEGLRSRLALVACGCLSKDPPDEQLRLIGFLIAHHVTAEYVLENVVVAAESRGRGVGTQLMQALFTQAEQTKSESVFLEVRESNVSARRLYEKLGFKETGRRKSYYTSPLEDAVLYTKALLEG